MDKKIDIKRITTKYDEDSPIKIDLVLTKFNRTHTACNVNATLEDTIDSKYRVIWIEIEFGKFRFLLHFCFSLN